MSPKQEAKMHLVVAIRHMLLAIKSLFEEEQHNDGAHTASAFGIKCHITLHKQEVKSVLAKGPLIKLIRESDNLDCIILARNWEGLLQVVGEE